MPEFKDGLNSIEFSEYFKKEKEKTYASPVMKIYFLANHIKHTDNYTWEVLIIFILQELLPYKPGRENP